MPQLERAVHEIEMRLSRPMELMEIFSQSGSDSPEAGLFEAIVRELETLPGVVQVKLNWHYSGPQGYSRGGMTRSGGRGRFMRFHRGAFTKIAPPTIDRQTGTDRQRHHAPFGFL